MPIPKKLNTKKTGLPNIPGNTANQGTQQPQPPEQQQFPNMNNQMNSQAQPAPQDYSQQQPNPQYQDQQQQYYNPDTQVNDPNMNNYGQPQQSYQDPQQMNYNQQGMQNQQWNGNYNQQQNMGQQPMQNDPNVNYGQPQQQNNYQGYQPSAPQNHIPSMPQDEYYDENVNTYNQTQNDFEQLNNNQVLDENAADEYEEESTNQFTNEQIEDTYEQPPEPIVKKAAHRTDHIRKSEPKVTNDPFLKGTDTQDMEDEDEYIDKRKKKVKPFGGKKSKPKKEHVKKFKGTSRFDSRKDMGHTVKIIRFLIMLGLILIFIFGVKNTFFQHIPNQDEIAAISKQANGDTGYPVDRGKALAEQFTEAYLTFDSNNQNDRSLAYFYNGDEKVASIPDVTSRATNGIVKQKVLVTPRTFDSVVANDYSAVFYVSTLVTDTNDKSSNKEGDQTSRWVALAINVLYDKKHNQLEIAPDSPALVPSFKVSSGNVFQAANAAKLGTGTADDKILAKIKPTILGYLNAYTKSTSASHSKVDQFIETKHDKSVTDGFGGKFTFDSKESGFTAQAFPVSDSENNKEWKVDMKIAWKDADSHGSDSVSYSGRYVMTIRKKAGKYFVEKFVPFTYTKHASD